MRVRFANDPANLLAVQGQANQDKGDKEPAFVMPPNTAFHCQYAHAIYRGAARLRVPSMVHRFRRYSEPQNMPKGLTADGKSGRFGVPGGHLFWPRRAIGGRILCW